MGLHPAALTTRLPWGSISSATRSSPATATPSVEGVVVVDLPAPLRLYSPSHMGEQKSYRLAQVKQANVGAGGDGVQQRVHLPLVLLIGDDRNFHRMPARACEACPANGALAGTEHVG